MKILGLDLGTNSIGWAVVEKTDNTEFKLIDKGVRIFQEGVNIEKGEEISRAATRTNFRSVRRLKFRRRLRKINVLRTLGQFDYCPKLSEEELKNWRYKKIYPENDAFRQWQKTIEENNINPYYYRTLAVERKMDLSKQKDRYILGRAFYHIAQRRGFLSNRLDNKKENDGTIYNSINEITEAKDDKTLGQYFYYDFYLKGKRIRNKYTHREKHYLEEFNAICNFQNLSQDFTKRLKNNIFYQRPLKSQKGLVGKCPFEPKKPRCPVSHPLFEEYRMLQFINNIKIKTPFDEKLRPLTNHEKETIKPLFIRSKHIFKFDDIAKKLTPKKEKYAKYNKYKQQSEKYLFNYDLTTSVTGNRTTYQLKKVFGENWSEEIVKRYTLKKQKTEFEIINDIWHVLFSFDKTEKLKEFAINRLNLDKEKADEFSKINLDSGYASLSIKAIKNIIPWLRKGLLYSHAVFLAKFKDIVPENIWNDKKSRDVIINEVISIIETQNFEKKKTELINGLLTNYKNDNATWSENEFWQEILYKNIEKIFKELYGEKEWKKFEYDKQTKLKEEIVQIVKHQMNKTFKSIEYLTVNSIEERISTFLKDNFQISDKGLINLYHPSAMEVYKPAKKNNEGIYLLGSPILSSIKNPVVMRTLHQLRKVVNKLLEGGIIDEKTRINIEMARELTNANERKAIKNWQKNKEGLRAEYKEQIKKDYLAETGIEIEPNETDILKYQLWEEQKHKCLYTGKTIKVTDFIGENTKFDIEHTIPRSISLDNSQSNLTLCDSEFNRKIKRNKIPAELDNYEEILPRIKHWEENIVKLKQAVEKAKLRAKSIKDNKEAKDRAIVDKHINQLELKYWQQKYNHFIEKEVGKSFKPSQLIDTGIITKYTRFYMKTVFKSVYTVKGQTVSDFRKIWGIQDEYSKKERVNHLHHCIDAITIACITKNMYEHLAKKYHEWEELGKINTSSFPKFEKPWETFVVDIKNLQNEILVSHYTPDNFSKQTKKKLKKRGKIMRNKKGEIIYQKGDTVRGSLHKETNYGAIKQYEKDGKSNIEQKIKYVVRKPVDSLTDSDIENIVDKTIKNIIKEAKTKEKILKKKATEIKKIISDKEKDEDASDLKHELNKIQNEINNLYMLPNKSGAPVPIHKVRVIAKTVTNPLHIKLHRDLSKHDYKHYSYFVNDGNYLMGIYENENNNNIKRDFIIINNFDAANYYRENRLNSQTNKILPKTHPKNSLLKLKGVIKTGTMVIFWKNNPEELQELDNDVLVKRLYKTIKMNKDGRITFKLHNEARNDEMLKNDYLKIYKTNPPKSLTNGESYVDFESPFPKLLLSPKNFNFLIENKDFEIDVLGKIKFLK